MAHRRRSRSGLLLALCCAPLAGCHCPGPGNPDGGGPDAGRDGGGDAGLDAGPMDAGPPYVMDGGWCSLPGTVWRDTTGQHVAPCAAAGASCQHSVECCSGVCASGGNCGGGDVDLTWVQMPEGFCVHHFAKVPNARKLRFAPGGELFVASPSTLTTGGANNGVAGIVVVPDDDRDGLGDTQVLYRNGLPSTQGLLFANASFYYQVGTQVVREPYAPGQRATAGATVLADITVYSDNLHWPKTLDIADDGTIYVSNGGSQTDVCATPTPFHGGVLALDPAADGGARIVARGLRNPIYVTCHRDGNNHCFASELSRDYSANVGGREKLLLIHDGDDWGYPCCAVGGQFFPDVCVTCTAQSLPPAQSSPACTGQAVPMCSPNCAGVATEQNSYAIGTTPFGFTFVDAQFPPPWDHRVFQAMHGARADNSGAAVVAIAFDPATGLPFPSSYAQGPDAGALSVFLRGWDNPQGSHGRVADVELSPDGRLFVADDGFGEIFWVAPLPR